LSFESEKSLTTQISKFNIALQTPAAAVFEAMLKGNAQQKLERIGLKKSKRMAAIFWIVSVLLLVGTIFWIAPTFLDSSDAPRKVDAVVLFVGPDQQTRLDEAISLLREGYARYLIISAYGEIRKVTDVGELEILSGDAKLRSDFLTIRKAAYYKKFYENTHVEALEAKRMMDELGLKSAMLVSSAYHMRRIRLIASRVFDTRNYSISCKPAQWQKEFTVADWLNNGKRKIIVSEYLKMGWFLLYGVLGN
jgi:uncharacterized SAM-binding protein YcdF (DUF218 family)